MFAEYRGSQLIQLLKCCGCARLAKDEDMTPRSDAEAPHREQDGFVINGGGVLIRGVVSARPLQLLAILCFEAFWRQCL
jgi:hypothetical protein